MSQPKKNPTAKGFLGFVFFVYVDFMVINEPNPLDPARLHHGDELLEPVNLLFPEMLGMIRSTGLSCRLPRIRQQFTWRGTSARFVNVWPALIN